jgi:2-methylcitrate dehydratase PrpD
MLHGGIDCLYKIIQENKIRPDEIESIKVLGHPTIEQPCFNHPQVDNVVDAQFNAAYIFAVVASGVRIGPEWQDPSTMKDPGIREMMKKVTFGGHPEFVQRAQKNMGEQLYTVDMVARGKQFHAETVTPIGTVGGSGELSDAELQQKFRHNAERILTQNQIDQAVDAIMELEKKDSVVSLIRTICL